MTPTTRPRRARSLPIVLGAALAAQAPATADDNPFATQPKADEVFYQIMPIAWRDGPDPDASDPNRFGDFVGMREGLDYLTDLGVTAVWMNPVFPSPAYHGYQHGRADRINPRLGTEAEFIGFVEAAHDAGIEVYLDFVVYGISHDSPWFADALANPPSPYDDWLAFENASNTQFLGNTFPTWSGDTVGFIHWDLRNPEVADLVNSWGVRWLDPNDDGDLRDGVDGYRLDHVWVNYGFGPDGWGYNLDTFWDAWHDAIRAVNPDVFTFAEQHDWGSHGAEYLPEFDAAMTKPLEFAARDALRNEHAGALSFQMEQTLASLPPELGTYVGIIGDHDVNRLSSSIGADNPATEGRAHAAAAVLMLQPFPPILYYGDEIGMLGFKADYGSDANDIPMREPFKWNALEGAPMSRYHRLNAPATINQYSRDNDGRSAEEQQGSGLLETYKQYIATRHAHVAIRRGSYHEVGNDRDAVWSFLRVYEQGEAPIPDASQSLVCVINLSGAPQTASLDLSALVGEDAAPIPASDIAPGGAGALPDITDANKGAYPVTVPPYSSVVIQAALTRPPAPPITIDGSLDSDYTQVGSNGGATLWAAIDGDTLYLATNPAQSDLDRFIVLSQSPGAPEPAMWAKDGTVASYDAYIGNESTNGWSGWFDAAATSGPVVGAVLEGAIDLAAQYGTRPGTVFVASLAYLTNDGEPLVPAEQVPGGNLDPDVQATEFIGLDLDTLGDPPCAADLNDDGVASFPDVGLFLAAFAAGAPEADLNGDGTASFPDVGLYLAAFAAGCP